MGKAIFVLALSLSAFSLNLNAQQQNVLQTDETISSAEEFVKLLAKGDFSHAVMEFDSTMHTVMSEEKTKELWNSLVSQIGHFKKEIGARKERHKQYDIVFITCEFEKSSIDVKIVFNREKEISGLLVRTNLSVTWPGD